MGAYTCEFGVVHKVCRCPTPHIIKCDKVEEHKDANYVPKHRKEQKKVYRISVVESERGWGHERWTEDYENKATAQRRIDDLNKWLDRDGPTPDHYIIADEDIKEVWL